MFKAFNKKIIDQIISYDMIYKYCVKLNNKSFKKYYITEIKNNKLKWSKIKNTHKAINKIEKSMRKSLIYWIIENSYTDQMIQDFKNNKLIDKNTFLINQEMINWIDNLPDNIEDAILSI
jgi:hypothetical protein